MQLLTRIINNQAHSENPNADRQRQGFSLIELLAAITILLILVGVMSQIFTESNKAWTFGTDQSMNGMSARAALDLIASDLENAIAYNYHYEYKNIASAGAPPEYVISTNNPLTMAFAIFPDRIESWGVPKPAYGMYNSDMCFVTLVSHDENQQVVHHDSRNDGYATNALRDTRRIIYTVDRDSRYATLPIALNNPQNYRRFFLVRREGSGQMAYENEGAMNHDAEWWWSRSSWEERMKRIRTSDGDLFEQTVPVVDNVAGFRVFAPDKNGMVRNYYFSHSNAAIFADIDEYILGPGDPYPTDNENRLPEYVDLCLDILDERDAVRANQMAAVGPPSFDEDDVKKFVERKMKRYTRRVYLNNRNGYRPRGLLMGP